MNAIEIVDGSDERRLEEIRALRQEIFAASRRDGAFAGAWRSDGYDPTCEHLLMRDPTGLPVATVRIASGGRWPLEDRFDGDLDKRAGAEFGRLGVARRRVAGRRTLYELMVEACRYCVDLGRPLLYGLTIAPFWTALDKAGVPLTVVSGPIEAYGEEQHVVRFDARELIAFYEFVTGADEH